MKKALFTLLFALSVSLASAQFSTVRINALALATGTINAGVDVAFADKWSVDVSGYWNPISTEKLSVKTLAITAGLRRWRFEPHVGLFYGVHSTTAKYDFSRNAKRYKGWLTGIGSSVGYSRMLARRWNFTVEGGLGLFYMNDRRVFIDDDPMSDIIIRHYRRVVLAPSKLEIGFSYLF